jgi:hypothetical protein
LFYRGIKLGLELRKEQKLFENSVLRRISGPKREVTGGLRKLNSDKLYKEYTLLGGSTV